MIRRLTFWNLHRSAILTYICLVADILSACGKATPVIPNTGFTGKVICQADQVEKGQSLDSLQLVEDSQEMSISDTSNASAIF